MTPQQKIEKVKTAIAMIVEVGALSYKEPDNIGQAKKFGIGIGNVTDDSSFLIEAAAEHCEDWNHHEEGQFLNKIAIGRYEILAEGYNIKSISFKD